MLLAARSALGIDGRPPKVLFADDFNRASLGATWAVANANGGSSTIVSNALQMDGGTTDYALGTVAYPVGVAATDVDVCFDLTFPTIAEMYWGVTLRATGVTATGPTRGYNLSVYPGAGVNSMGILKTLPNDTGYQISNGDLPGGQFVAGQPKRIRFRMVGSTIFLKTWNPAVEEPGPWIVSIVDSEITDNANIVFSDYPGFNHPVQLARMDNLVISDPTTQAPLTAVGDIKVWTGSAFAAKPAKFWTGSAWVKKPVKVWNGSAWVTTTY